MLECLAPNLDPKAVCVSMKGFGPNALAEVLFRAFIAEQDGRRALVRLWLEVYRQLVEEDRPMEEHGGGNTNGLAVLSFLILRGPLRGHLRMRSTVTHPTDHLSRRGRRSVKVSNAAKRPSEPTTS
jgi:hypothetical protein